ncbi:MAG: TIGR00266 family protein [Lachnospiraceae bacterium]
MRYQVIGDTMPAVEVTFDQAGESMYTQSGGMAWMSEGVAMDSNMRGGLGKSIGRMFSGESIFMATYRAERPGASIAFASTVAGEVLPVDIGACGGLIAQKGAFLCSENTVELSVAFTKKLSAGLFGGEGFILQDIHGTGMVFLEVDGNKVEKVLAPGEVLKVDTGNVVAFEKTVNYEIETVKGLKNIFFGGEGLFLTKLTGPGRVILQTQNFNEFAGRIISMMPSK